MSKKAASLKRGSKKVKGFLKRLKEVFSRVSGKDFEMAETFAKEHASRYGF
ncbi:MAG: hypothetical protein J6W08_03505 [Alphaproteobacteria bacterium]|nr:hypothetical protein [Alphaproteobacteria bacterium]